ncbi:restriction endonuclease subunit S [Aliarcobacter cryaerophilus]|uniref:restriction endonuclease subunit S n=1 Tax=Aliarcobacter cryaerophilus TaxID=28198 RepID=UPI00112F4D9F|nr:restriction endonuclease subunit S [Aliarcobacter cryaerophilus]
MSNKVKLQDYIQIQNGYAFKSNLFQNFGIPVVRITNVENGKLNLDKVVYYSEDKKLDRFIIKKNDILLSLTGDDKTLKVCMNDSDEKIYLNQRVAILRSNESLIQKYLYYSIKKYSSLILEKAKGIAQKNISVDDINSLEVPLPSIEKQKQIAKTLDKANELIELRKESITKLDALAKSIFIDMFGDPVSNPKGFEIKKLKDLTTKITDGTHKTPIYKDKGIIFLSAKNVKNETLNLDNCKYISLEEHQQLIKRCNPEYLDILLTKSGSIGMCALVPQFNFEFSVFESLCLIKFDKQKTNPFFLKNLLNSEAIKSQYKQVTKGIAIKHLHLIDIKNLDIIYPPIELQNKFAKIIEKIEEQKSLYEKELEKLQINFDALLQKSFQE